MDCTNEVFVCALDSFVGRYKQERKNRSSKYVSGKSMVTINETVFNEDDSADCADVEHGEDFTVASHAVGHVHKLLLQWVLFIHPSNYLFNHLANHLACFADVRRG